MLNVPVLYLKKGGKIKVSRNKGVRGGGGKPSWMQNLLSDLVFQSGGGGIPPCAPPPPPMHPCVHIPVQAGDRDCTHDAANT